MHFIGRTFSHYRVVKKLGAGGMGIVCQAVDTRLGRSVALKFLSDGLSGRPLALARFQREARAASALNHPNICTLYDIGEQDGKVFLVLEFLEGETLQDRTGRGPCQPVEFFRLATQILGALEAAHDAAILHRDIKPANIFITARGEAKILDFGLAKLQEIESPKFRSNETAPPAYRAVTAATVDEDITSTGAVIGTVAYMSPEQARGEQLDARSDLFSCGALLYEMATAQQAFSGGTLATTFDALLNRNPIPPSQLNPQFTPAFDTVIARSLEKDRNRRYCSASALLGDLRQLEHRVHAAGASSELDIAALSPRTEFDDSIAVWPFEDVAGNDDTKYLCEAITETIINSLSRLTRLRVIPRTTIFAYRSKDTDPVQACRQLRARTVLSGRIRKTGDDLILDAELIDAVHNSQLWGAKYKRTQLDLLAVQQEISNEVSDRLRLHLTSDEKARLTVGSTRNREAFHLLVKGRHHTNK